MKIRLDLERANIGIKRRASELERIKLDNEFS